MQQQSILTAVGFSLIAFSIAGVAMSGEPEVALDDTPTTTLSQDDKRVTFHITANRNHAYLGELLGEPFTITISMANWSKKPMVVFNPGLNSLGVRYMQLAIFNAEKEYLGDLLHQFDNGSKVSGRGHREWCQLAPQKVFAVRRKFIAGSTSAHRFVNLPPGRYYIQLMVDRRFFSESPWNLPYYDCGIDKTSQKYMDYLHRRREAAEGLDLKPWAELEEAWRKHYPGGNVVRSNVLTIIFLPRPVEAPKP